MYESLLAKNVKIVWSDNGNNKAVSGTLIELDDSCLSIRTEKNQQIIIHKQSIISCKELMD